MNRRDFFRGIAALPVVASVQSSWFSALYGAGITLKDNLVEAISIGVNDDNYMIINACSWSAYDYFVWENEDSR